MPRFASVAGALGRMAGRRAARDKIFRATWSAASVTARTLRRVVHLLFLEITGFLFLSFAVVGGGAAVREYHKFQAGTAGLGKAALAAVFCLMFLWFGISSFYRARRRSSTARS